MSVEEPEVGFVPNATVVPAGAPFAVNVTLPENPEIGVIVTVYVAAAPPRAMVTVAGLTESEKSGALVTLTWAVSETSPAEALTVNGPPAVDPAMKRPLASIAPPPLTPQLMVGCVVIVWPDWSRAEALKCTEPP